MSNAAKQIYRRITNLFPDLHTIKPFTKLDLKDKGLPDMELTVIDSTPDKINFILSRYENERGQLIANPSIEIVAEPKKKTANVATYKDRDYFHSVTPKAAEIGTMPLNQANRYLYDWLSNLNNWNRALSEQNFNNPLKISFHR